ncbi:MAG: galactokinase [Anaerolineales bacterium]|jgi:galactokinase
MDLSERVTEAFKQFYDAPPDTIVRAPGRVNLIGEHTDYNDGFVLPMAIDRALWIALRRRKDNRVLLHSLDFDTPADFSLHEIEHGDGWTEYVRGIAWVLSERGYALNGWEGVITGDVPIGAGLSSSAALELSLARAFWAVSDWEWDGKEIAQLSRLADNQWVGISSGIMDQMISAEGKAGHALLIDCRSLETSIVPLPPQNRVVILDTATRRGLVDSAYNERVAQCQVAARYFEVSALRDVSMEIFEERQDGLDPVTRRRARHVVTENVRTLGAVAAMRQGDAITLGKLMTASHQSLRDDYEVSSKELDIMVELAQEHETCYGVRMTGAGFGGCAVALVQDGGAAVFSHNISQAYQAATGLKPNVFICTSSNGAEVVES